jgi:hypothetical protein
MLAVDRPLKVAPLKPEIVVFVREGIVVGSRVIAMPKPLSFTIVKE